MAWRIQQVLDRTLLDQSPGVEHADGIGELGDQAHVVADEQYRGMQSLLQAAERLHDLALNDDVKGAGRLVGDDDLGLECRGDGHRRPLALTATELMRVTASQIRLQANLPERARYSLGNVAARDLCRLSVGNDAIGDLVTDTHDRVERVHGRLWDQRHLAHAQLA